MTERTFRSPSPHRPTSSGSAHRQSQSFSYTATEDMPPVPALPRGGDIATRQGLHHSTASLGARTTPLRLASQILASEDAPSWFGASKIGDPSNVRRTDPAMASPPSSPPQAVRGEQQAELVRSSSRSSSVNFSYPSRARVGSPTAPPAGARNSSELQPRSAVQEPSTAVRQAQQPQQAKPQPRKRHSTPASSRASASNPADQVLVYDPNSRRMVRQVDLRALEQAVRDASAQPAGSKRKKQNPQRAGSHLAKGTMGRTKINTPAVEQAKSSQIVKLAPEQPTHPSQALYSQEVEDSAVKALVSSPRLDAPQQDRHLAADSNMRVQFSDPALAAAPTLGSFSGDLSQQTVKRQPSVLKEEPELESETERTPQVAVTWAPDTGPAAQSAGFEARSAAQRNMQQAEDAVPSLGSSFAASPLPAQGPMFAAGTPQANPAPSNEKQPRPASEPQRLSYALQERATSSSPVRQAHFGSVSNNLTVRHSPPPRSISPRKSALKHSSSPNRGASPSDDTSEASGGINSREELPIVRKKSVRVSFDDENTVVVGESASANQSDSPVFASPQHTVRRPWYSSIGRNKKELPPLDDDEIMKPRPALPSFGSVRDRKPREPLQDEGERPLVRPIVDRLHGSTMPKAPSGTADGGMTSDPPVIGQSSDYAVGAILAREQEERSKVPANTSRYREPLPPVVTSVEGSGYMSDSSTSSNSELESQGIPEGATAEPLHTSTVDADADAVVVEPKTSVGPIKLGDASEMTVPAISISQPTPPVVEKKSTVPSFYLDVPGGFPQDDSDLSATEGYKNATVIPNEPKEATLTPPPTGPSALSSTAEPSSDSESSIYSDAYEDLSEIEGDGFQSLNAVLEAPVLVKSTAVAPLSDASPRERLAPQDYGRFEVQAPSLLSTVLPPAQPTEITEIEKPEDEWEKVKAYWKNLTADKRAQLEREATEDAGIEGDLEEVQAVQKPKKKKSVERRNSERKALAVHMAQQMVAQQQKQAEAKPVERNYMIQPGTKWAEGNNVRSTMQTTLRGQPPQQSPAATTRDAPRLRKSMRASDSSANGAAQPSRARPVDTRPASMVVPSTTLQHQRASEPSVQHNHRPLLLKRRGSTSSESSFKRTRPGIAAHVSGFRTSMRQASPPSAAAQPEQHASKRFSLRSLSPPNSTFKRNSSGPPVSMATGMHMRQTLRDSSSERKKSSGGLRLPGFGSKKAGKQSGSQFSSRFGDSSDEDGDGGKSGFRSRFEDSSDDEAVSPIVLPRTIPRSLRNQDSAASTALPEELEESEERLPDEAAVVNTKQEWPQEQTVSSTSQPPAITIRPTRSGPGRLVGSQTAPALLTTGPAKATERRNSVASKRGSLMMALRRKKRDSSGKISRPEISESAARRDTKLERNASQLRDLRGDEDEDDNAEQEKAVSPPRSPKLQKRVVSLARSIGNTEANAATGGDLPSPLALTASPAVELPSASLNEKEFLGTPIRRPSSRSGNLGTRTLSGLGGVGAGAGTGAQSGFLERRTLSAGVMSLEAPSAAGTSSTRKKKFGALRRMFGLSD
jgi:serine/arginine repetitive matrix protein 2